MKSAILLGLRLSTGKGGQRARTLAAGAASTTGTLIVLLVWGIAASALGATTTQFQGNSGPAILLMAGAIGMVALPVIVLIATISRLSASVRDRRLANLRLLGLSANQTRLVASVEAGVVSIVGSAFGAAAAALIAVVGTRIVESNQVWAGASVSPPAIAWAVVPLAIPAVAVLAAVLPQRLATDRALTHTRQRSSSPVRLVRVAPLLVGFLLCSSTRAPLFDRSANTLQSWEIVATLVGIALLGIGMLLVIPVFMSLIAAVLLRFGRGPLATLVGRRLQTQPAGATRVIAALMMGLFIVVGARGVLVVFLATPQYVAAADFVERDQTAEVSVSSGEVRNTLEALEAIEGVRHVNTFPVLQGEPPGAASDGSDGVIVLVATCEDLTATGGPLAGCSRDAPSLVGDPWITVSDPKEMQVRTVVDMFNNASHGPALNVDLRHAAAIDQSDFDRGVGALSGNLVVVVPPDTPGVAQLLPTTDRLLVAHAGPGRLLYHRVGDAGYRVNSMVDIENYDFVQGMLVVVWILAAVVIAIGLATFTIAGVDRAIGRRRELTALRLIGTPQRLLRRAQWLEAALPTVLGTSLAIAAGAYAGATYLQRADSLTISYTSAITLALTSGVTSLLLAWLTTLGTASRLDPEHIRSE